jgi:hypothetical protein
VEVYDVSEQLTPNVQNIMDAIQTLEDSRMEVAKRVLSQRGYLTPKMVSLGYSRPPAECPFGGVASGEWSDYLDEARNTEVEYRGLKLEETTKK